MDFKKFTLVAALLAAPAALFAQSNHYISVTGAGSNDGSSWDNAMPFSTLCENIDSYANGDVFYFKEGTYVFSAPLKVTGKGYTFIGGFSKDLTGTSNETPTYPTVTPTIFSGDANGDGVANEGDSECLFSFKANTKNGVKDNLIVLKGLDFTGAYSQASPGDHATARGALHLDNCGWVEVDNCRFYGNVAEEPAEGNAKQVGGMALTSHRSLSVFNDCEFTDNKSTSRGGAIRLTADGADKGKTTFNRCLIARNTIKNDLGSAICMQHGTYLQIVNSTVTGNVGADGEAAVYATGADNTYPRSVYIVNSTVAGNEGGPQVEMTDNANLYVANSIVVSEGDAPAFSVTSVKEFVSGGMNIVGSDAAGTLTWGDTDDAQAGNNYAAVFGENVLGDNGVIEPLAETGKYTAAALAEAIADWGIEADVTVDQTGKTRAEGSTPGAYAKTTPSGIQGVEAVEKAGDGAYYTLQGVKLGARPTATGIYIHNGKKVIIR
jgi:hypothetical protein